MQLQEINHFMTNQIQQRFDIRQDNKHVHNLDHNIKPFQQNLHQKIGPLYN